MKNTTTVFFFLPIAKKRTARHLKTNLSLGSITQPMAHLDIASVIDSKEFLRLLNLKMENSGEMILSVSLKQEKSLAPHFY